VLEQKVAQGRRCSGGIGKFRELVTVNKKGFPLNTPTSNGTCVATWCAKQKRLPTCGRKISKITELPMCVGQCLVKSKFSNGHVYKSWWCTMDTLKILSKYELQAFVRFVNNDIMISRRRKHANYELIKEN
jgi:hypothetical protein